MQGESYHFNTAKSHNYCMNDFIVWCAHSPAIPMSPYWELLKTVSEDFKAEALKGQCHAIWKLYKKLGVFVLIEFQN